MSRRRGEHGTLPSLIRLLMLPLVITALLLGGTPVAAAQGDTLVGEQLLEALRGGGYVILFRHAATDQGQSDTDRQNLGQCATQRNLSEQGREQSVAIGRAFRRLGLPVGRVLASPYCRTLDTARLAFGDAEPSADLVSQLSDAGPGGRQRLTDALRALLAEPPKPGLNTVLVTHVLNIDDAVRFEIEEGEAIVVRPDGTGSFAVVARVLAETWDDLDAPND
jgi:broad specificity phosphatase PhoE